MPISLATIATFSSAYAQSDFFGKLIILSLVILSLLCWIVLIQKLWQTRKSQQIANAFEQALKPHLQEILQVKIQAMPKPSNPYIPHPFGFIFHNFQEKTMEILNKNLYFAQHHQQSEEVFLSSKDIDIIESHVLTTISSQTKSLEKNLFLLSTITTLAPFIGLLGTVWGILVTFSGFNTGGAVSSNTAVLGGISTALVTTVLGLVIAIPALVGYNYLKATLKNYTSDMQDFLYQLLSTVELQYRRVDKE